MELLMHLGTALQHGSQQMLVWDSDSGGEGATADAAFHGLVDGVTFAAATTASMPSIERTASRVPVVLVHRSVDAIDFDQIEVDNTAGGRLVAKLFIDAGRRLRLVFLLARSQNATWARMRPTAYPVNRCHQQPRAST